jgi:hypothetical protein
MAALAATPACAVLEAPSNAAIVATPSAAVAEAPSKSVEAAASPATVLGAAVSTATLVADDVAPTTTPAAGRQLLPSYSGSSSSASDMSWAEDGISETDGFHKPCRRRNCSP